MKSFRSLSAVQLLLLALSAAMAMAAGEVEITKVEGHYLDRLINMVIEWQSTNPVVKARITVGRETREMLIDEYDNRRDHRGYHGTLTLQLPADPQPSIPYTIQLEDDLRQLSTMTNGKITPSTTAAAANPYGQTYGQPYGQTSPQNDDNWGRKVGGTQGYRAEPGVQTGSMVDRLIQVADRFDLAPSVDKIKVNILSPDNVSFSTKANDDKGLAEVRFKVYDRKGVMVGTQNLTGLGKIWSSSSQTFTLGGGLFRVTVQAIDTAGNTSKEESTTFELTGKVIELPAIPDAGQQQYGQTPGYQNQPVGAGTTYPSTQPTYDASGQAIPPAGTYQQPAGTYPQPTDPYQQQQGTYQTPTTTYPAQTGTYPSTVDPYQQPVGAYQQPAGAYQQPAGTYQQPAGTYQQPAMPTQPPPQPGTAPAGWW
jgi:hypothetical protein